MSVDTQVTFSKQKTTITIDTLDTQIQLIETKTLPKKLDKLSLYLLYNEKELFLIGNKNKIETANTKHLTQLITIFLPKDIEVIYLERHLSNLALEKGIKLIETTEIAIPENIQKQLAKLVETILLILEKMGYPLQPVEKKKAKPRKARHKWTKEVSEKEFFIDTRSSQATVMWIKRNQMLIKKGATMMKEAPLNKDGSVGFSAKMGDKIRSENLDKFKNFVTTEDIILKSVNEVGLFLYFAGTNSWLEMIDKDGQTLNELTVVE